LIGIEPRAEHLRERKRKRGREGGREGGPGREGKE
jgi:hypothetical protein